MSKLRQGAPTKIISYQTDIQNICIINDNFNTQLCNTAKPLFGISKCAYMTNKVKYNKNMNMYSYSSIGTL